MDTQIITTLISGIFSIVSAFGAVILKDYLDRRKEKVKPKSSNNGAAAEPVPKEIRKTSLIRYSFKRPISILSFSFFLGIVSRSLRHIANINGTHYESLTALIKLILLAIILLSQRKKSQEQNGQFFFQLEMITLWSGFVFGWSLIHGEFWGDLIGVIVIWWLGFAIIGGTLLHLLTRQKSD